MILKNLSNLLTPKYILLSIIFINLSSFLYALYLEYFEYLDPCPLCIMQRISMIIIIVFGILTLPLLIYRLMIIRIITIIIMLLGALSGIVFATYHIYIQSLDPTNLPSCGQGLELVFKEYGFKEAFAMIWKASGNCNEISKKILYLSLPEWGLVLFITSLILIILFLFKVHKKKPL